MNSRPFSRRNELKIQKRGKGGGAVFTILLLCMLVGKLHLEGDES